MRAALKALGFGWSAAAGIAKSVESKIQVFQPMVETVKRARFRGEWLSAFGGSN